MTANPTDGRDPAAVFALLGDETRLEILAALFESGARTSSFSTLHDRVGIRDSGQFNYHLSQLVPRFVSKVDDGYRLTSAGRRVARAVEAGYYTGSAEIESFETDGCCPLCGSHGLVAAYTDEQFRVDCEACGGAVIRVRAPPTLVRGRTPREALAAFDRWSTTRVTHAHEHELCPHCGGPVERDVRWHTAMERFEAVPVFECRVCSGSTVTSFGALARTEPLVRAFADHNDLAFDCCYYWEIPQLVTDRHLEVSEEPWRATLAFPADDVVCRITFDESHAVVRTETEAVD